MTAAGARRTTRALAAAALALASGCSLVYDADDLRGDAGDEVVDPDELHVARLEPAELDEGEGSAADEEDLALVRPVPLVLVGQNMTEETRFEIELPGEPAAAAEAVVSGDGTLAALLVRVPVLPALGADEPVNVEVRYAEGEVAKTRLLVVNGLGELVQDGGALDTDELADRYSVVALTGEVTAAGEAPLRLRASAGIRIDGTLAADGDGAEPGPGGCGGGPAGEAAPCGAAGGKAGESSGSPGGGGGGGFGPGGGTAGTGGAGQPGAAAGTAFLAPFAPDGPAGAGGGGGGQIAVGTGRAGGGGGGAIELSTPGVLALGDGALVRAAGADGGNPGVCATGGGGGGGGSGGAILLRAGGALQVGAGAALAAPGGEGGGPGDCAGGGGGVGRIRVDRPGEALPAAEPAAHLGPMIALEAEPIARQATVEVLVRAAPGSSHNLYLGQAPDPVGVAVVDGSGAGTAEVTLVPGRNILCVQTGPGADLTYSESQNCLPIAYIPR